MPKTGLTDVTVILDRSGSMNVRRDDTIEGFKTYLTTLAQGEGDVQLSLVQFDEHYEPNYSAVPLDQVKPLTNKTYIPRGSTALLDALGRTITETGARLAALPEDQRPEKVIIQVITDGQENASKEYRKSHDAARELGSPMLPAVDEMIRHQTEVYQWVFQFIGTNQDAIHEAGGLGVAPAMAMNYTAGKGGMQKAYKIAGQSVNRGRANVGVRGMSTVMSYTADEREDAITPEE